MLTKTQSERFKHYWKRCKKDVRLTRDQTYAYLLMCQVRLGFEAGIRYITEVKEKKMHPLTQAENVRIINLAARMAQKGFTQEDNPFAPGHPHYELWHSAHSKYELVKTKVRDAAKQS